MSMHHEKKNKSRKCFPCRLLQQMKDSPSKMDQNGVKVQAANDAVQAIKQLRKEIVAIMSQLLCLAKSKNSKGMLPLCNEMVTKTRVLLNIWEPSLVEEAFEFIENHRTVEEPDNFTIVILFWRTRKRFRVHNLYVSANVTV